MNRQQFIEFTNSTIVEGATSTNKFLSFELNNKNVGVPLYEFFTSTPILDFVDFIDTEFTITNATLFETGTAYNAGVSLTINNSAVAWPIYKVDQEPIDFQYTIATPTIVGMLQGTNSFVAVKVNGDVYGVPMYTYASTFPNLGVSAAKIENTTVIHKKVKDIGNGLGSTNLNSKIRTYRNLIDRILFQLGEPYVNVEVCEDSQMVDFIDKAIEWYTKYAGYTEEYLVFNSELYKEPGLRIDELVTLTPVMRERLASNKQLAWDYDLKDYRRVIGVFEFQQGETTGINTLFTLEQSMAQQTYFSYMLGNAGFDLVTWEVLKGWLDLREKVLAQIPYIDFDQSNQLLRIIPAPNKGSRFYGIVGCWVEKPIKDVIRERWVEHYALAITKLGIANVRGKYGSVQLFGGGSISWNDLLSQGLEEKKALEDEIMNGYGEVTPARFWLR